MVLPNFVLSHEKVANLQWLPHLQHHFCSKNLSACNILLAIKKGIHPVALAFKRLCRHIFMVN